MGQCFLQDCFNPGSILFQQLQPRSAHPCAAYSHQSFDQLDLLHELRTDIQVQQRQEPFVQFPCFIPATVRLEDTCLLEHMNWTGIILVASHFSLPGMRRLF